jgi:hypothetical protein
MTPVTGGPSREGPLFVFDSKSFGYELPARNF